MTTKTFLSPPTIFPSVKQEVELCYQEGYLSTVGPHLKRFEAGIEVMQSEKRFALATNSATSAIHLGLKNIGVEKGDVVLCQSLNFIGCLNPILYLGAEPVLIDSEADTWNMDPAQLVRAIDFYTKTGNKPKAIIAVHIYGMPFKVVELKAISEHYGIPLLEDAAEALGSSFNRVPVGGFGDQTVYSFNGNKIISTSGGGMLLSKTQDLRDQAQFWANQSKEQDQGYLHKEIGYNYGMSNLLAAVGCGMLPHLQTLVEDRRRIFQAYREGLRSYIDFQTESLGAYSNRWLSAGLCESEEIRDKLIEGLAEHQIESRPVWRPMHLQPLCKDFKSFDNGISENLWRKGICLPSGFSLDPEPIIERIKSILDA